jgi:hypothetical protein
MNILFWKINVPTEQENRLAELEEDMNLRLGENPRRWRPHFTAHKPKRVRVQPLFENWRPHVDGGFKNGVR